MSALHAHSLELGSQVSVCVSFHFIGFSICMHGFLIHFFAFLEGVPIPYNPSFSYHSHLHIIAVIRESRQLSRPQLGRHSTCAWVRSIQAFAICWLVSDHASAHQSTNMHCLISLNTSRFIEKHLMNQCE